MTIEIYRIKKETKFDRIMFKVTMIGLWTCIGLLISLLFKIILF